MVPLLPAGRNAPVIVVADAEQDGDGVSANATVVVDEEEGDAEEDEGEGTAAKIVLPWAGLMVAVARFANEILERSVSVNCW